MAAEIIKTYIQNVPALRFIGKKYGNEDRINGSYGKLWDDWFKNGRFEKIEKLADKNLKSVYEDGDAYIGLMRWKDGEPFEYWIGIYMSKDTEVPAEFDYKDFPESKLGVCWLYGGHGEVYGQEGKCAEKLAEEGHKTATDSDGAYWFMERYGCPRFTTPDDKGKIILDICWYI